MNCEFVQSLKRLFLLQKSVKKGIYSYGSGYCGNSDRGVLSVIGIIITNMQSNRKIEHQLDTAQAVTDCKIDELTREVREHNNFARRVPVVEEQIKAINHRIADLEQKG